MRIGKIELLKAAIPMLTALLLAVGCGVKDKGAGQNLSSSPLVTGNLPDGVWSTKNKRFILRPSTNDFTVGEMTVTYKVVTSDMDLPTSTDHAFTIHYWMPEMPQMPVTPAKIEVVAPGQVKVTYDISMGGLWEITLTAKKTGGEADTLTYSFNVPE